MHATDKTKIAFDTFIPIGSCREATACFDAQTDRRYTVMYSCPRLQHLPTYDLIDISSASTVAQLPQPHSDQSKKLRLIVIDVEMAEQKKRIEPIHNKPIITSLISIYSDDCSTTSLTHCSSAHRHNISVTVRERYIIDERHKSNISIRRFSE